ncbi:protein starmaker-like, partial [Mytilus edulis]
TDELKAEIRNGNMELKALFNNFKAGELKADVTKGNMELRAIITDLINATTKSESSGQKDSTQGDETTSEEDDDDDEDSSDHMDGHDEEAKDDIIDNDDVETEKEQKQTGGADTMSVKGEKWFTQSRTPSQPSSSKSKLTPKANTKSESSGQKDSTKRDETTSDEDEDSQYMHYQGNTKHEHSEDDDDDDEDSSDHMDFHDEEAKDDIIDNDDVETEKEQKQTGGAGEKWFTQNRTPSQPSSSRSKLTPKAHTKSESSVQTDSTPRDDTISSEDEDSQYMHYQGNTKHKHSGDDDDDVDSSDHMDGHEEEAKDDKIDNDELEMTKEQKKTDIAVIEMLCVEPINVTPSTKHTFSSKQNSPPEPILPAQGKPKKSHKLQKLQEKEPSDTSKPIVQQTKHNLCKTEKKKSVKEGL